MNQEIAVFEQKKIRHIEYNGETYFSVIDIIESLTDSNNPNRYWTDLKRRSQKESGQLYAFCVSLKLQGTDGKFYKTDCTNTEGVFRIIQSVPSPKAEPFKMWLAGLGKRELDTKIYTEDDDAQGFEENHDAASKGGKAAGNARRTFERDTKRQVISNTNFLKNKDDIKKIKP
jgi:prophage antirepressor-like protein